MTGYELSRQWFNFCFENPEKVKPNHTALYFFAIEHCNRLGWKEKFGLPTEMAKEAIGIKSYNTYIDTLTDLIDWRFITMIQKSKNQYSSNIISLCHFHTAYKGDEKSALSNFNKALDNALIKHGIKHSESTDQSIDSIIKLITNNIEPITARFDEFKKFVLSLSDGKADFISQIVEVFAQEYEFINQVQYSQISKGKERAAAAKILKLHKEKNPKMTSEETLESLQLYFKRCVSIDDDWLRTNMSLSIIVSKFNEINNKLKNGNKRTKNGNGATDAELAGIVASKFASDRPE